MPFTVIAAMGQHLEAGMTYIFQMTQTQVVSVKAISATLPTGQQSTFFTEATNFNVTDYEVFGIC